MRELLIITEGELIEAAEDTAASNEDDRTR